MDTGSQQNTIKAFRLKNNLSIEQLSRELGVAARTVYRWERGLNKPSKRIMKRFESLQLRVTARLTSREREILIALSENDTVHQIANIKYLSEDTVKTHIRNIYKKFGFENKEQLIKYAIQQGLIS